MYPTAKIWNGLVQFADNLAARSDADARATIPNPPPMSAPIIA